MPDSIRFANAESLPDFVARTRANHDLWVGALKRAALTPEHVARAAALPGRWHVLVLLEDRCGDAVNSVPYLHRLAEATPGVSLRVLERDQHLDLMDTHRTNGARAIPMAIVYDAAFCERGQWGSRPAELQRWVETHGLAMEKDARYKQVRTWYARDKGVTTVEEMLSLLESLTSPVQAPGMPAHATLEAAVPC
jgi:hypothetical protein